MRVALSADMEGVSQLDDWRGLLTGGADEVVVLDTHASGNTVNARTLGSLDGVPYFDLTSEDAMTAVQDKPLVREGRDAFEAWLARAGRAT